MTSNGVELEVEQVGPDDGEPLVLVMGIGAQLVHWPDGFCDALVGHGFRVLRFDNRDVGLSTHLARLGVPPLLRIAARRAVGLPVRVPYTLFDMADDVAGLMDALGLRTAHLAGISMGGMVAQSFAIRHPTRLRSLVSMHSTPGGRHHLGRLEAYKALLGPGPRSREQAIERGLATFRVIGSPGFERDEDALADTFGRAWDRGHDPKGFYRQLAAVLAAEDREGALRRVDARTLVIHGADDPLIPLSAGRATAHAIPGARLEVLEGLGHDLPRGAWGALADLIADHALV